MSRALDAEVTDYGCWRRSKLESWKTVAVAQAPRPLERPGLVTPPLCVAPPQSVWSPSVGSVMLTDAIR